jgi:hypothetical protein
MDNSEALKKLEELAISSTPKTSYKLKGYLRKSVAPFLVAAAASLGHLAVNQVYQTQVHGEPITQIASEYKLRYHYFDDRTFHNYLGNKYLDKPLAPILKDNPQVRAECDVIHEMMWADLFTTIGFGMGAYFLIKRKKGKAKIIN